MVCNIPVEAIKHENFNLNVFMVFLGHDSGGFLDSWTHPPSPFIKGGGFDFSKFLPKERVQIFPIKGSGS